MLPADQEMMSSHLSLQVVAGFLGVTGLSIMKGALTITTGVDMASLSDLHAAAAAYPWQLAAALLLAGTHFGLARRLSPGAAFLLLVPSTMIAFFIGSDLAGASQAELVGARWLFAPAEPIPVAQLWAARDLGRVQWGRVLPDLVSFLSYSLICMVSLMLKVLGVEASARRARGGSLAARRRGSRPPCTRAGAW